jgi:hypothetical protein
MGLHLFRLPNHAGLIIAGVIVLIYLAFKVAPMLFSGSKARKELPLGSRRDYGLWGGTICPKCHRPFSLGVMPIKIGFGTKLVRCEFCGKWSLAHRLSLEELRAAEDAELADARPEQVPQAKSEAARLSDLVDDSRFTDRS